MRIVQEALTFDDVLLVPAYSDVLPREVDLSTRLTRGIRLNIPFVSAAMDSVTEARLAITIAQEGGIGIIHKNMTAADQAREVGRVKKHESGVIKDPITVRPDATIREVIALTRAKGISGLPVTADGDQVVGIVTHRDIRFEEQLDLPVSTGHDAAGETRDGAREHAARGSPAAAASAPHRESAGGRRRRSAARDDHGQGHPESARLPARLQGRTRAPARRRRGRHGARHARSRRAALRRPASTSSSSTPRMAIRAA